MKNYSISCGKLCFIWLIFICTVRAQDKNGITNPPEVLNEDKALKEHSLDRNDVINRAKVYLHLLLGKDAYKYYNNPKAPPEIMYMVETKRWNVFFYQAFNSISVRLSDDIEKGNCLFLNGGIKKNPSDEIDSLKAPLYTLNEFIVLLQLDHNKPFK